MKTTSLTLTASLLATTALADVETSSFTFENEGAVLSGTLYVPEGHDGSALPTVIVTGAWTTVEEQMPSLYAREMVERGFAAVTFDFRGWGKSGDLPGGTRFEENPEAKISDIRAAIDAMGQLPEVDAARIHGLGICASAGYMVDATSGNDSIQSVGLIAPWLQDAEIVASVYGGDEGVAGLKAMAAAAERDGGQIIAAAGPAGTEGVLMAMDGYYADPARGAIPAYDNQWNNTGWDDWLSYHPVESAGTFDKPLAIVHSEAAAIPQGVQSFLNAYAGQATLQWLEDVTQFDFYDNPEDVERAADTVAAHFDAQG